MTILPFGRRIPLQLEDADTSAISTSLEWDVLDALDAIEEYQAPLRDKAGNLNTLFDVLLECGRAGYVVIANADPYAKHTTEIVFDRRKRFAFMRTANDFPSLETQWIALLPVLRQHRETGAGPLVGLIIKPRLVVALRSYGPLKAHLFLEGGATGHEQMAAFAALDQELPGLFENAS